MPGQFYHGVEVVQINDGTRSIETVKSSVICAVGTAPDADPSVFPLNTPVIILGSRTKAAGLDTTGNGLGTLPPSIDGIFDQCGAMVVVIRVEEGADIAATKSNIIGGIDAATGLRTGVQAILNCESIVKVAPKLLIAPGFTHEKVVVSEMLGIADKLRAIVIADGPNTKAQDAIDYRQKFGSKRVYIVDPAVSVWDTVINALVVNPASARVAGVIAKSDNERGFWWSPSNREIYGIDGAARPIDASRRDPNSEMQYLNGNAVATIIRRNGDRLFGNRTCSADPKWAFIHVVRIADMLEESIQFAHDWAVDQNITKGYLESVVDSVNGYMSELVAQKAILGGECWVDKELNPAAAHAKGEVFFDFDFGVHGVAEHITFRSHLSSNYHKEIF